MEYTGASTVVQRIQMVCLVVLAVVATGFALAQLGPVLVPFVMALLLTYCLKPATEVQVRQMRFPRLLATVNTMLLGLGVLLLTGLIAAAGITALARNLGPYRAQLQQLLQRASRYVPVQMFGFDIDVETGMFVVPEQAIQGFLAAILAEATFLLSNGALIFVFMLFLMIGSVRPPVRYPAILQAIESRVRRYLLVMVAVSVVTGSLVGATLQLLGVPFALLFGFLAFLLNFIPNVGSIIATLLPLPVIVLEPEMSLHVRILAFLVPAAIQFITGNLLVPRIQGAALNLHPVAILLAIIYFGMIWGIAGAFLATPILAVIKIALERSATTAPFANLLAGDFDLLLGTAPLAPAGGTGAKVTGEP